MFQYNAVFEVAVSVDEAGIIEYWGGARQDYKFPKRAKFESKLDTDLFEFVKHKTQIFNLCFSPDGTKFATISADHKVFFKTYTFSFIYYLLPIVTVLCKSAQFIENYNC